MKPKLVKTASPHSSSISLQMIAFGTLILLLMGFSAANAQTVEIVGEASASGSGCPSGTVSAVVAPDGSSIALLFSDFVLNRPAKTIPEAARSCSFSIPIRVQPGFVLQATRIDYRGFAQVPPYGFVTLSTSNLNGVPRVGRPSHVSNTLGQNFQDSFTISQMSTQTWDNRCMNQSAIQFTTTMVAGGYKNPRFKTPLDGDVLAGLDSADIGDSPVSIGIKVIPCRR